MARVERRPRGHGVSIPPPTSVEWLVHGSLVITKVLQNALAVVDDAGLGFTVDASIELAPGGFAVFAVNAEPALNGGLTPDFVYDRADFVLGNGSDEIVLSVGTLEIDRVAYDNGLTFPDPEGASMSLDPGALDADANDAGAAWCVGVSSYGAGDLGTPGAPNPPCAP